MELLLALVGAAVAFLIGWSFGRSGRPVVAVHPAVTPPPADPRPRTSLAEVLDEHRVGVVIAGPRGEIVYRNPAASSLSGTHVGVLVDEAVERHIAAAIAGAPGAEVLELYGPPRTVVDVRAVALDEGVVVFVEDVSQRRRSDQVRTDFVANVSHELKTPIGAMSVLAETLLDETDPDTIRRVVERMMTESDRASRTIEDLMELSRIELGGERSVEPVRVSEIVAAAVERVGELAARREITVSALEPVDGGAARSGRFVVAGDRRQLVSAVGNLVENAVKYSPVGGSVQVRVRDADDRVEIAVIDHGVGIPQRDLDRIFERFYRVDRARSRVTGGTGLGLSIVRHVATNHGGEVVVTSTEGEGSTFVLRLPTATVQPNGGTGQHREGVA